MRRLTALAALALVMVGVTAHADDHRGRINYMLHCQGCHLPDGAGVADRIPQLKDFVGLYLHDENGRAFVINVSGVATAPLPDDQLSELINWVLLSFSGKELPKPFRPYTAGEVSELRKHQEPDPAARRKRILERLRTSRPDLEIPQAEAEYSSD